jgi:hypothetical protein
MHDNELQRLASRPENRVMQWQEPGEARPGAFSARQLSGVIEALKTAVIDAVRSRPGQNELMVRWRLGRRQVPGAPEGYTWAQFAEHYPTFWGRLTSASSTRKDVITIHAMVDARRRFEDGEIATERDVEAQIQNDLLALNMDRAPADAQQGRASARDGEVRALLQQAKMRRTIIERAFAGVTVPTEELARHGVPYSPSLSCLHEIQESFEALAVKLAKKGSRSAAERKRNVSALKSYDVMFARSLLQLRVAIAKRCLGLPEPLDPKGASFMPTFTRSAQVAASWTDAEGRCCWVAAPQCLRA